MLKRLRGRLSFANIISMIALFAALGGGYAVAFSGSGTLQKAKVTGLGTSTTTVRELTGIGSVQAECDAAGDGLVFWMRNTSGVDLRVANELFEEPDDHAHVAELVGDDENGLDVIVEGSPQEASLHLHIYPDAVDDKRPQADVVVHGLRPTADCADASVSVLALNTEE